LKEPGEMVVVKVRDRLGDRIDASGGAQVEFSPQDIHYVLLPLLELAPSKTS
jgi:hypothetical protein